MSVLYSSFRTQVDLEPSSLDLARELEKIIIMSNNLLYIKRKYTVNEIYSYMLGMKFILSNLDKILNKWIVFLFLLYASKIENFIIFLSSKLAQDRLEIVTT
jgi:hypothetical protein